MSETPKKPEFKTLTPAEEIEAGIKGQIRESSEKLDHRLALIEEVKLADSQGQTVWERLSEAAFENDAVRERLSRIPSMLTMLEDVQVGNGIKKDGGVDVLVDIFIKSRKDDVVTFLDETGSHFSKMLKEKEFDFIFEGTHYQAAREERRRAEMAKDILSSRAKETDVMGAFDALADQAAESEVEAEVEAEAYTPSAEGPEVTAARHRPAGFKATPAPAEPESEPVDADADTVVTAQPEPEAEPEEEEIEEIEDVDPDAITEITDDQPADEAVETSHSADEASAQAVGASQAEEADETPDEPTVSEVPTGRPKPPPPPADSGVDEMDAPTVVKRSNADQMADNTVVAPAGPDDDTVVERKPAEDAVDENFGVGEQTLKHEIESDEEAEDRTDVVPAAPAVGEDDDTPEPADDLGVEGLETVGDEVTVEQAVGTEEPTEGGLSVPAPAPAPKAEEEGEEPEDDLEVVSNLNEGADTVVGTETDRFLKRAEENGFTGEALVTLRLFCSHLTKEELGGIYPANEWIISQSELLDLSKKDAVFQRLPRIQISTKKKTGELLLKGQSALEGLPEISADTIDVENTNQAVMLDALQLQRDGYIECILGLEYEMLFKVTKETLNELKRKMAEKKKSGGNAKLDNDIMVLQDRIDSFLDELVGRGEEKGDVRPHQLSAEFSILIKQSEHAKHSFETALQMEPNNTEILISYGQLQGDRNMLDKAVYILFDQDSSYEQMTTQKQKSIKQALTAMGEIMGEDFKRHLKEFRNRQIQTVKEEFKKQDPDAYKRASKVLRLLFAIEDLHSPEKINLLTIMNEMAQAALKDPDKQEMAADILKNMIASVSNPKVKAKFESDLAKVTRS